MTNLPPPPPPPGGPWPPGQAAPGPSGWPGGGQPPVAGTPPYGPVPVVTGPVACYRHANRETQIRCSRCGKPICPDCMNEAPVGFHCPDCVREGRATQPRTMVGARIGSNPGLVTMILVALNVAMFAWQQFDDTVKYRFIEVGRSFCTYGSGGGSPCGVAEGQYYRLLTSMFLHANVLHIALNMWALWILGQALEPRLGWWRFLALYLAAGMAGSTLALVVTSPGSGVLGASGGIYGLFAALWVVWRRLNADTSQITFMIVLNLVFTFTYPNVSWQGHLGGLAAGGLIALVYAYTPKVPWRTAAHVAVLGAVFVVIAVAAVVRAHTIPDLPIY